MLIETEPNVWRLHTKPASDDGKPIADYCLDNNVIAIGWSLHNDTLNERNITESEKNELKNLRDHISTFEDYVSLYLKFYGGKVSKQIYTLHDDIKINDLIWMRHLGKYYLGRVGINSKWQYSSDQNVIRRDASNQRTDIEWIEIGEESDVPGGVTTAFIRGYPIQHIWKDGIKEYSMYIYNKKTDSDKYKINLNGKISPMNMFYHYISPSGCEDLVCMYLYKQYGYICIPSTNKKSTELYECVLLNPKNGHKIYIQVKCGQCDLDALDYMHLDGEVYLFTSGGNVKNINQTKNISVIYPDELFKFAFSRENRFILPKNILTWCEMITEIRIDINL